MKNKEVKNIFLSVRLDRAERKILDQAAQNEQRSKGAIIRHLISSLKIEQKENEK